MIVIKPSHKTFQALSLPKVLNLNPRSIYNKLEEFSTFVKEEEVDLICMSESWEREEQTLDKVIKIDDFKTRALICIELNSNFVAFGGFFL